MEAVRQLSRKRAARPFHLDRKDDKRYDATFTVHHEPFHGVVYYAVPPDDPSQTIERVELQAETSKGRVEAVKAMDGSPYKKPLLKLELEASNRSADLNLSVGAAWKIDCSSASSCQRP